MLRKPEEPSALVREIQYHRIQGAASQDEAKSGEDPEDLRTYGIGAQILCDLGVRKMRLMSAPKIFHGLAGFGLEVVEYIN